MNKSDLNKYKNQYEEGTLMSKISRYAKKAGLNTIYYVLLLYNLLISNSCRIQDKALILGALGYFICPLDMIPDLMVGTGYLDDATMLIFALGKVASSITPQIRESAKAQLHELFDFEDSELNNDFK